MVFFFGVVCVVIVLLMFRIFCCCFFLYLMWMDFSYLFYDELLLFFCLERVLNFVVDVGFVIEYMVIKIISVEKMYFDMFFIVGRLERFC